MSDFELFGMVLVALGWIIFQVLRRVFTPSRPLGTIRDEEAPEAPPRPPPPSQRPLPRPAAREVPLDTTWGRAPAPPLPSLPPPAPAEPFRWSVDAAQPEIQSAREVARRQARAHTQQAQERRSAPHPYRPRLRSRRDLRQAVVLAAVLGPCRALEPYEPPEPPRG